MARAANDVTAGEKEEEEEYIEALRGTVYTNRPTAHGGMQSAHVHISRLAGDVCRVYTASTPPRTIRACVYTRTPAARPRKQCVAFREHAASYSTRATAASLVRRPSLRHADETARRHRGTRSSEPRIYLQGTFNFFFLYHSYNSAARCLYQSIDSNCVAPRITQKGKLRRTEGRNLGSPNFS